MKRPPPGWRVQSIHFDRATWTKTRAKKWLRANGFRDRVEVIPSLSTLRATQRKRNGKPVYTWDVSNRPDVYAVIEKA